ncbi:undecaprenyl-phosphate glucose phosphotransferase [Candidatus Epulonipiscium fishelsonii]|uniref:Undecaprenyl-phosphate glucose phosphotransferase n=1 Tax=Candidatus Epulonipiscium fishelsonii TaxID=77094 RepID=A0ACC8XA11_9FIRM|nr:undecaprenyl-phosphate glucose phosphotransferase [Epulopiscium sp. SCG-D08WGA-EpuloA1]OON97744.1 MAG: undecaprenyl-phosphate glucose phosphotransferase [Epulopiscium sp. AS2M-Bin002]
MIRENQNYLNRTQVLLDMIIVWIAFIVAYWLRFFVSGADPAMSMKDFLWPISFLVPFLSILYHIFDLYNPKRTKVLTSEIAQIIKANIIGDTFLVVGLFVVKMLDYSRVLLALFFIINIFFTCTMRIIIKGILRQYHSAGYHQKNCIIIGVNETANAFINKTIYNKHWGYNIFGLIDTELEKGNFNFLKYKMLGNIDNLEKVLEENPIDMIFIALETNEEKYLANILNICENSGIKTSIIPYYYRYIPAKPYMDDLDGLPVIDIRHVPLDNVFKSMLKRAFDICFALVAILITSPLLIFSAIMVKATSKGPIIFKQERVGLNRKTFYMYKFRSMKVQTAAEEKVQWTTKNDPRKTKWGTFMRKTSIDELPQFFNVLKGDMTVVGPRPERPYFVEKLREDIPRYMIKHQVRPGITGWAQVNGFRGDTSIEERIAHDLYYIENWSFFFDIKTILLTFVSGFVNKNAY